jgi:predicted AAA+ superfamily ATPase
MQRLVMESLQQWIRRQRRKSLILRGARQVGKTWAVRELAKSTGRQLVEINFERDTHLRAIFDNDLDPKTILNGLELRLDRRIHAAESLLFLDEVQDCPRALTALKHFTDSELGLPVIAAGSYLGMLEGATGGVSQPIGYVDDLTVFPMSFEEFLLASDPHPSLLESYYKIFHHFPIAHERLLNLYREYLYVGGMPEAVKIWFETGKTTGSILAQTRAVRDIQKGLLTKYKSDFAKYHPRDALNIARTWELVAEQLARSFTEVSRFRFKDTISGKRDYKAFTHYFARLDACGLTHRSFVTEHPIYPLKSHKKESMFKCYFGDTGLLLAEMDVEFQALEPSRGITYKGPLAENFVANNLVQLGFPLFAFVRANGSAEIEFLIQNHGEIIPIEVKNNQTTAKSLRWYLDHYQPPYGIKFSNQLGSQQDTIKHYPIYCCGEVLKTILQVSSQPTYS